jgi:hypothetical protein
MNYIEYFKKKDLLTDGKSNTKTAKNNVPTYYLSLQPTDLNSRGINLCRFSTKECRTACLQYAGRQSFDNVRKSREAKTEFFVNHRKEFIDKLWKELKKLNDKGKKVAIRLNLLSDLDWQQEFTAANILYDLSKLNNIQFYDYTKDHFKVVMNRLPNYDLTLSFSGHNWKHCENVMQRKIANVAAVFKNTVPLEWNGFKVVNGDLSDERFLEDKGVIVGLKYKTPKGVKYEKNPFVIEIT